MSKLMLVIDITVPQKLRTVISITSTRLDSFVLFCMSEILPPLTFLKRLSKQLLIIQQNGLLEYLSICLSITKYPIPSGVCIVQCGTKQMYSKKERIYPKKGHFTQNRTPFFYKMIYQLPPILRYPHYPKSLFDYSYHPFEKLNNS